MKRTHTTAFLLAIILLATGLLQSTAQTVITAPAADTVRVIQILQGKSLREKLVDSITSVQTIAGNVILKEGLTVFYCDSAIINKKTNVLEAFGNIHINQQDSIHTYAQYLKYIGQDRIAYLKKNVRLTDNKGTLYTQELEYDLKTNIGNYKNGGRVVNGKTTLTSEEGVYYADVKDVFFKKNVHLVDPKYNIRSDSLQYNTQTQIVNFITQTHIKSKDGGDVYTSSGSYDLKNGKAFFTNRTVFKDSTRTYVADISALDEATGTAQLEGNAVIKDSVNGYTILGNQIFLNQKNNSFLATRKPVLIFKGEGNDSTFIAADTLFSGVERRSDAGEAIASVQQDTLKQTMVIDGDSIKPVNNQPGTTVPMPNDSVATKDSAVTVVASPANITLNDSITNASTTSAANTLVPEITGPPKKGKQKTADRQPATMINKTPSNKAPLTQVKTSVADSSHAASDTVRYFQAFHNVRIYNDSLQAVCDSLYYTSRDSVFRLFNEPLVFSNRSQIAGDTIHLYTKNKKADRIYVFENGIMINEVNSKMYNQIAGRTLDGYFKEGAIDYMRVKGSPAESVFYPQDSDSAYTGMNRCKGDVIDIYFADKTVNKVKFINDVDGIFFPIRQIPEDQKLLTKFKWLDSRRPKNKLELFE